MGIVIGTGAFTGLITTGIVLGVKRHKRNKGLDKTFQEPKQKARGDVFDRNPPSDSKNVLIEVKPTGLAELSSIEQEKSSLDLDNQYSDRSDVKSTMKSNR